MNNNNNNNNNNNSNNNNSNNNDNNSNNNPREAFSPITKMRIARVLQKQGDTEEALKLQYQVMEMEVKENGEDSESALIAKGRIANLRYEQGNFTEALQMRHEILSISIKSLHAGNDSKLTQRRQIEDCCARLRLVADSLTLINSMLHKFRKSMMDEVGEVVELMQEIGDEMLDVDKTSSAFDTIQDCTDLFDCTDGNVISTLCLCQVFPREELHMETLLGYIEAHRILGADHKLSLYITLAIFSSIVALVVPIQTNRRFDVVPNRSDEIVSLTHACRDLVVSSFLVTVWMDDCEKFWDRWSKLNKRCVDCLRILKTIPNPIPELRENLLNQVDGSDGEGVVLEEEVNKCDDERRSCSCKPKRCTIL